MTLSCPGCHAKHKFRDDIAVDRTVYVKCPACGHMMMISPKINNPATMTPRPEAEKPAAPALPPEIAAAIAAARASLWRVDALELAREELDTDQVKEHIARGTIDGDALIAHVDKNDWRRIADVEELRGALVGAAPRKAQPEPARPQPGPEVAAAPPGPPFVSDMGRVVTYPLRGKGPVYLLVNALFLVLASFSITALTLVVFNGLFAIVMLRESIAGRHDPPGWEAFTDLADLFLTMVKVGMVSLVAFLPVMALNVLIFWGPLAALQAAPHGGDGSLVGDAFVYQIPQQRLGIAGLVANSVVGLVVMLYYPMSLVTAIAFESVRLATSPSLLAGSIRTLGPTYRFADAISIVIVLLAAAATLGAGIAGSSMPTSWLASIPAALVVVYLLMCMLYMLGRMVHENAARLGWSDEGA